MRQFGDTSLRHGNDREVLGDGHGGLTECASEFWSSLYLEDAWPPPLLDCARQLVGILLGNGCISDSVQELEQATLVEIAEEIVRLAKEMDAVSGDEVAVGTIVPTPMGRRGSGRPAAQRISRRKSAG